MFQSFEKSSSPADATSRVKALRTLLIRQGLDALIPRADEHQGEYVPASAERLKWLTGFTGSAGLAIITASRQHCSSTAGTRCRPAPKSTCEPRASEVAARAHERVAPGKLGKAADRGLRSRLHTFGEIEAVAAASRTERSSCARPRAISSTTCGARERPPPPMSRVSVQPLKLAGRSAHDKIADIQARLREDNQHAVVLTCRDSLRGRSTSAAPTFPTIPWRWRSPSSRSGQARTVHRAGKDRRGCACASGSICETLIRPRPSPTASRPCARPSKRVRLDPNTASSWFARALGGPGRIAPRARSLSRAQGGEEYGRDQGRARGARAGRRGDRPLPRLARRADATAQIDEIEAVRRLEGFRRATEPAARDQLRHDLRQRPNGAIVHYRVNAATNRKLRAGELFLIDSGAQYLDGTTDITRTVAIGKPTPEMRERFTLVLKGHIAIATARFPEGHARHRPRPARAARAVAARPRLRPRHRPRRRQLSLRARGAAVDLASAGMAPLVPGMICSNEPGYYKEGAYGIRIENLVLVTEPAKSPAATAR